MTRISGTGMIGLLVLLACGGQQRSSVHGRVLLANGRPAANVPVVLSDKPTLRTDSKGEFQVVGVAIPYDAALAD